MIFVILNNLTFSGILYRRTRTGYHLPDGDINNDDIRFIRLSQPLLQTFPKEYARHKEQQNLMKQRQLEHQVMLENIHFLQNPS